MAEKSHWSSSTKSTSRKFLKHLHQRHFQADVTEQIASLRRSRMNNNGLVTWVADCFPAYVYGNDGCKCANDSNEPWRRREGPGNNYLGDFSTLKLVLESQSLFSNFGNSSLEWEIFRSTSYSLQTT